MIEIRWLKQRITFQNGELEKLSLSERLKIVSIKTPQDYIAEIIGPELHDGCNLSEDENDEHTCENNSLKASNSSMKVIKIGQE